MTSRTRRPAVAERTHLDRVLLALVALNGQANVDQLVSHLGNIPPEAIELRLADLRYIHLAVPTGAYTAGWGRDCPVWAITVTGRRRAAELTGGHT